jgi:ribosomal protein L9
VQPAETTIAAVKEEVKIKTGFIAKLFGTKKDKAPKSPKSPKKKEEKKKDEEKKEEKEEKKEEGKEEKKEEVCEIFGILSFGRGRPMLTWSIF